MKSRKIRVTDPETLDRQGTKKHKGDVRGAFKVWARELPGHHAFLLAMLKNGLFEFSDLKQHAELLASERSKDEGDTEEKSDTPNRKMCACVHREMDN